MFIQILIVLIQFFLFINDECKVMNFPNESEINRYSVMGWTYKGIDNRL